MDNDTTYDMSFEDIQAAIMSNMPKVPFSQCIPGFPTGDEDSIVMPFERPKPEELFKLSDEDERAFEELRVLLTSHKENNTGENMCTETKTKSPGENSTKVIGTKSSDSATGDNRIKCTRNSRLNGRYREQTFKKYYPTETVLSITQGSHTTELDRFLESYHVPEDELNRVFDFSGDVSGAEFARSNEQTVLEYLQKASQQYRKSSHTSNATCLQENPTNMVRVEDSQKKTVFCDLRNTHSRIQEQPSQELKTFDKNVTTDSSSDSGEEHDTGLWLEKFRAQRRTQKLESASGRKENGVRSGNFEHSNSTAADTPTSYEQNRGFDKPMLDRDLERLTVAETFLERRKNYLKEVCTAHGLRLSSGLLLHEEATYNEPIPLLGTTAGSVSEGLFVSVTQPLPSLTSVIDPTKASDAECCWSYNAQATYFAFLAWLVSLVVEEEEDKSTTGFTTIGLLQMASVHRKVRPNIPLVGQPKLHALLVTNLHPLTQEEAKIILEDIWTKEAENWKVNETLLWDAEQFAIPSVERSEVQIKLEISTNIPESWMEAAPNIFQGHLTNEKTQLVPVTEHLETIVRSHCEDEAYCANQCEGMNELSATDWTTVVIEVQLSKMTQSQIKQNIFALLLNVQIKCLDVVGVRLGWIKTPDVHGSCQRTESAPCLAVAIRGPSAWSTVKNICTWMTTNWSASIDPDKFRCFGSRFEDLNTKHVVRWFGPRLPDVAVLSPVRLARVKHQITKLLDNPNDCWIVNGSLGDIMITLSYDAASILADILKDLLQRCGYVLVSLALKCGGEAESEKIECCQFSVLGDSDRHVETDIVKETKSVFGVNLSRVFPYFVIILRRENAVNHFYVTLKQIRFTLLNSIKKNPQNWISDTERAILQVLPFTKSLQRHFMVESSHQKFAEEAETIVNYPDPPHSDCEVLRFIMFIPCLRLKSGVNSLSNETSQSQALSPSLRWCNLLKCITKQPPASLQAKVTLIACKWLPVHNIPQQGLQFMRTLLPLKEEELKSWSSSVVHKYECGIGLILARGCWLERRLSKLHNNQVIIFTDIQCVSQLTRTFFFPTEIHIMDDSGDQCSANNANKTVDSFEQKWNSVLNSMYKKWQPEEITFTLLWPKNLRLTHWLEKLIKVMRILMDEGFVFTQLFTTNDGETHCRAMRPNAIYHLKELIKPHRIADPVQRLIVHSHSSDDSDTDTEVDCFKSELGECVKDVPQSYEQSAEYCSRLAELLTSTDMANQLGQNVKTGSLEIFDELLGGWSSKLQEANLIALKHHVCATDSLPDPTYTLKSNKRLHQILELLHTRKMLVTGIRMGPVGRRMLNTLKNAGLRNQGQQELTDGECTILAVVNKSHCAALHRLLNYTSEDEALYTGDENTPVGAKFATLRNNLLPKCRLVST
ncbi:hypothetical protein CSKR_104754 [Clonorchis sinensis]|uniref:Uncharacterized protein n=1 Tax=Clonorchis sinensis TaxID=79923 RepID=A0A8T1MJZ2_CLOSI|nr:hypothetical protein CSKR_104754 [Clonorchis sinensis]